MPKPFPPFKKLGASRFLLCIFVLSGFWNCSLHSPSSAQNSKSSQAPSKIELPIFQNPIGKTSGAFFQKQVLRQRLDQMKQDEHKNPLDIALKYEIAAAEWCLGEKSLAYENWAWIRQYAPHTPQALSSSQWMSYIDSKTEDKIAEELPCPTFETAT